MDRAAEPLADRLTALALESPPIPSRGPAAVLLALSPAGRDDFGIILVERPRWLRHHAGQVALPGGAVDSQDADVAAAALREAEEEVGLDPAALRVLGALPSAYIWVSGFEVVPVVALWDGRAPLIPSLAEVARVLRPTLRELADPARHGTRPIADLIDDPRRAAVLPAGAWSPVFVVQNAVVWGFTAGVLAGLLHRLGLPAPPVPGAWPPPAELL